MHTAPAAFPPPSPRSLAGLTRDVSGERPDEDPTGWGVPAWVEREVRAYLRCGVLAHGTLVDHDGAPVHFSGHRRDLINLRRGVFKILSSVINLEY